uniref:Transmembrane 9 superfamily member n=1 Tax=Hirondellea gigas TaxID=1518452 RepID=A0A2P2I9F1_9CRUS
MNWGVVLCLVWIASVFCDVPKVDFAQDQKVPVYVNTVGNPHNPAATEEYYHFQFCKGTNQGKGLKPGSALAGDRVKRSPYSINFLDEVTRHDLCTRKFTGNDLEKFVLAIKEESVIEIFVDGLPTTVLVGKQFKDEREFQDRHRHNSTHRYLYTHYDFDILYNDRNIIAVTISPDPTKYVELSTDMLASEASSVTYSYSVRWDETDVLWENRALKHIGYIKQPLEIHWISITNSAILAVLLTGFLSVILMRVLRKDFTRYMDQDEEIDEEFEDSGWKQVRNDVFRSPRHPMLFAAGIGNGCQILVVVTALLILALGGTFDPGNRGTVYVTVLFLYAATAGISGYVSAKWYRHFVGAKRSELDWKICAVATASLYVLPFLGVFAVVNTVAIAYSASTAMPFINILSILLLWTVFIFPVTIFGASRGRISGEFELPCKTSRAPRQVPPSPWYKHIYLQMFMAGFLPFTAIYIELHYVFTAVWGDRVYTLFGILFVAFILLLLVTSFVTIVLTYFQLTIEDHRWWWRALISGGSTGLFVYAYAIFFFAYRSEMSGVLQGTFFFGYVAMISYAFFLMLGAVGFLSSFQFIKYIYGVIKSD